MLLATRPPVTIQSVWKNSPHGLSTLMPTRLPALVWEVGRAEPPEWHRLALLRKPAHFATLLPAEKF